MLTGDFANLLLNTLIVVLLVITIAYCWLLNRRIKILQDSRGELALLLKHFDESTKRASDSIIGLQTASKRIGENVQMKMEKSNDLLEDLAYMIEKGEKIANKLEASFAVSRAQSRVMAQQPVQSPAKPVQKALPVEPPERAPANVNSEVQETIEAAVNNRQKTAASLEAVLERVVGRSKITETETASAKLSSPGWPPVKKILTQEPEREEYVKPLAPARQRSQAEQELLDMIKTGIKG